MGTGETIKTNSVWHFAIIKDVEETAKRFWNDLGIGPWQLFTIGGPLVRAVVRGEAAQIEVKAAVTQVGNMFVALDQCLSEPDPYADIVKTRGGGAHHLAFLVDNLVEDERKMNALGYDAILSGHGIGTEGDGGGSYFDTKENMGTVIELAQIPKEMPPPDGSVPPADSMDKGGNVPIKGAVHLALAVRDAEKAARHYQEELGVGPWRIERFGSEMKRATYKGKEISVDMKVAVAQLGPFDLALEQPLSSPSPMQDFLDQNGQGIHHVCFAVDELEPAIAAMQDVGYGAIFTAQGFGPNGDGEAAYFDTQDALGVIIELAKVPSGM
jgi:methylmalonyl-CoA/ethylmalonyl-CoA epimerase